ncbi:MAG: filamentous hemagglutinin N-terminal domain-containing protein [Nitrospina sp.]|nr:filamentous hemagglutinin N-terminal domain-containing protein [Nitrospina sp.]
MSVMKIGQRILIQSVLPTVEEKKAVSSVKTSTRKHHLIHKIRRPGRGLTFLVSLLTYLVGIFPSLIYALPTDGTVQAGSAAINQVSNSKLNISQSSDKSIIDWSSFSIAGGEHVNFQVPSDNSVTLNRVTGNDPSSIFGKLTSNGNLMLINRNGILFGNGAEIDVHGLVATTSDMSNKDFINGQYNFNIAPEFLNTITNSGTITAAEGGLIAFVAPGVQNTGIINARLGKVSLAAGNTFTLDLYGDQLVSFGVNSQVIQNVTGFDGEQLTSFVSNSGNIYADGGTVAMDVKSAQGLVDNVINMSGYVQAQSIIEKNGSIYLTGGSNGLVSVSGTIDASGLGVDEAGGIVHILGNKVGLYDYARIDISGDAGGGLLLVGGDYQGLGSIPTALENYVGPNVSIFADAVTGGNGGRTIFWADRRTEFFGTIRSRGGRLFGDGGFAEVSGKEELYFAGSVDTTAANGKSGTLLLDPDTITISGGSGTASASGAASFTTYEDVLESVASTTNIDMLATSSITLGNSLSFAQTSGQSVTFTATNGNISFSDSSDKIETSGGSIVMSAGGTLSVGAMATNGGDITLTGADFNLSGALNAGAGTLTILGGSGETIGLDGTTAGTDASTVSTICDGAACGLTLVQSELTSIAAAKLVIGDSSSGNMYVDGVSLSHISGGVTLNSNDSSGSVKFGTGNSTFKIATVNAGNGITISGNLTTDQAAVFNSDYDANGTGLFTISSGKTITSTNNQSVGITANDINIAGSITSGTGSTTIAVSDGGTIGLGGTSGNMTITGAELANITAGTLNIGDSSTGNITVDGISAANSNNATTVNLTTASASNVSFSNNDSTFNAFTANGGSSTSFGSGLTIATDTGKLALESASITSAGALTLTGATGIDFGSGVTFTAGGDLTMSTTSGNVEGAGAFTLTSAGDISLSENLTTAGATVITADSDASGAGNFSIDTSTTLSTGNNSLTLTANDVTVSGSINSGTGSTTIAVSDGGTIGLGGTSGNMTITGTELGNITAGTLNIGNGSTGNITVDGISAANSNNATTVNLTTASASNVSFSNNASTFQGLGVSSGNGINQGVNLTTSNTTTLDADSNDDGSGDFSNTAGAFSTGGSALSITANDFDLSGSINSVTGATTILISDAGSIGLGSTSRNMTITGTELENITAGTLTIGDNTAGAMTVNGISSANSTNITTVDLNSSSIAFSTGNSTFKGLTATANTGAITGAVSLTVAGTSIFTTSASNQSITLSSTSNDFTGAVSFNTTGSSANATLATNSSVTLGASTIGGDQSVTVGGTSKTMTISGVQDVGDEITLKSSGDLTLTSSLVSSSNSDSTISLTSTGGGIFDGDSDGSTDIEAENGRLVVVSNGGFGTSTNPIETTLNSIDLTNNSTGDVNIFELDGIEISTLTQNVDGGDITVSYSGSLRGQDLATLPDGSLGTKSFTQRQTSSISIANQTVEGSGKSVGDLSVESTVQLANTVEGNVIQMTLQKRGSDNKSIASIDSGGSTNSYLTDIFSDSNTLVEYSSDLKEINAEFSGSENFGGREVKEVKVAKLGPALNSESKVSDSSFQKNKSTNKQVLWEKMVKKVTEKKPGRKKSGGKNLNKSLVGKKSVTNKNQRNRSNNLTPTLVTRPFERGNIPIQQRSFR